MGLIGCVFLGDFSPQIPLKRLSPQIPLLQATRHLQASCKMIRDPKWGLEGPKCVKTSRNIINTPSKYPQTHLETFFSGHFSPQIAQKWLSPQAPPLQATRPLLATQRVVRSQIGVWRAQNASKPSGNIINTPQTIPKHIWKLFFRSLFTPNRPKTAKSPTLPLQATRHLLASPRLIMDPNWGLEVPKCVNTIRKHHKYPPKVSPNTFGNFFLGHFSSQIAQKRLSPQP